MIINKIATSVEPDAAHPNNIFTIFSRNTDGSFELVVESQRNSSDSSRKQIFKEIFLFYNEIVFCVVILIGSSRRF